MSFDFSQIHPASIQISPTQIKEDFSNKEGKERFDPFFLLILIIVAIIIYESKFIDIKNINRDKFNILFIIFIVIFTEIFLYKI